MQVLQTEGCRELLLFDGKIIILVIFVRAESSLDILQGIESLNGSTYHDKKGLKIRMATVSKDDYSDSLIIDSDVSPHITKDFGHFSSLEDTVPITVHLAITKSVTTTQQSSVLKKTGTCHGGTTKKTFVFTTKVLYIPESALDILSCPKLDKSGISTRFDNGNCLLIYRQEKDFVICSALPIECKG